MGVKRKMAIKNKKRAGSQVGKGRVTQSLRSEFEVYSKGIMRLEELKRELNSIDTSGYQKEANSIKSKMSNVANIPAIEGELENLKSKIYGKTIVRRPQEYNKLQREIKQVEGDIPSLKRKIKLLEEEIKQKRKVSCKKQLSGQEMNYVKNIPHLESELENLRHKLRKPRIAEGDIDTDVASIIEDRFGSFRREVEAELSKRIRDKEDALKKMQEQDIDEHEKEFKLKAESLTGKFAEIYKNRVESELKKEVSSKFDKKVQDRISNIKAGIKREYTRMLQDENDGILNKRKGEQDARLRRGMEEIEHKRKEQESKFGKEMSRLKKSEEVIEKRFDLKMKIGKKKIKALEEEEKRDRERMEKLEKHKFMRLEEKGERRLKSERQRQTSQIMSERQKLEKIENREKKMKEALGKQKKAIEMDRQKLREFEISEKKKLDKRRKDEEMKFNMEMNKLKQMKRASKKESAEAFKNKISAKELALKKKYAQAKSELEQNIKKKEMDMEKKKLRLEKEIEQRTRSLLS